MYDYHTKEFTIRYQVMKDKRIKIKCYTHWQYSAIKGSMAYHRSKRLIVPSNNSIWSKLCYECLCAWDFRTLHIVALCYILEKHTTYGVLKNSQKLKVKTAEMAELLEI